MNNNALIEETNQEPVKFERGSGTVGHIGHVLRKLKYHITRSMYEQLVMVYIIENR